MNAVAPLLEERSKATKIKNFLAFYFWGERLHVFASKLARNEVSVVCELELARSGPDTQDQGMSSSVDARSERVRGRRNGMIRACLLTLGKAQSPRAYSHL